MTTDQYAIVADFTKKFTDSSKLAMSACNIREDYATGETVFDIRFVPPATIATAVSTVKK